MNRKVVFDKHIIMVGFGAIGKGLLPLLFTELDTEASKMIIVTATKDGKEIAEEYGVTFRAEAITPANYKEILKPLLHEGDLLLNMSVDVSSLSLIALCKKQGTLYIDLSVEPWKGDYVNADLPPSERTNYALRERALRLHEANNPTAVITHGANPGMVSHFMKQALINMAEDNNLDITPPEKAEDWALLAQILGVKSIHIAERDTQHSDRPYNPQEFVNTWSVDGFIGEGLQPAELGWGTHERHFPKSGKNHEYGCKSAIYLEKPGINIKVRSWSPSLGAYHAFLITHAESISISNYLSLHNNGEVCYRPTVHYAYLPCPQAILSLHQLVSSEGIEQPLKHILLDDITEGFDEVGVLLMGNAKGAYWYGSTLSIHEAREIAPYNSATSLQVVGGALAAICWAIEHPNQGVIEPEDIDYEYALEIATPFLGKVHGHYTSWTPLDNRGTLFKEEIDRSDPWLFVNILVNKE